MTHQEKLARRFLELNNGNPEDNDIINGKIDLIRDLHSSAEATIEANGGKYRKDDVMSDIQKHFIEVDAPNDKYLQDNYLILSFICDEDGKTVYGVCPFHGVIPFELE